MKQLTAFLLSAMCFFAGSCKTDHEGEPIKVFQGENFTFYQDMKMYQEALAARQKDPGNTFTITDVTILRNGANGHDFLEIKVTHNGGCKGDFALIWDGAVMESYPEQIRFLLKLNNPCETTQPAETILHFDLDQFVGQEDLVDRATFHVQNGSVASGNNDMTANG